MPVAKPRVTSAVAGPDRRPTAVGAYIFAGGFIIGVRAAGFRVLAHLEDGGFGVATARANFPDLAVHEYPDSWPIDDLRGVDLVYCNPPCSPWSTAGIVSGQSTAEQTDWRSHPKAHCVGRAFSLLSALRPKIWCFESVRSVYSRGSSMLDDMAAEAMGLGYSVTDLFVEAKNHGVPQHRKRYFMVCHSVGIDWSPPGVPEVSVDEVLLAMNPLADDAGRVGRVPKCMESIIHLVGQGQNVRAAWAEQVRIGSIPADSARPAFIYDRMAPDRPSFTLLGSCNKIHPHEDRMLSVAEQKALCRYPDDFILVGSTADRYAQIGKGVCPPVAEWLATQFASALRTPLRVRAPSRSCLTILSDRVVSTESGPFVERKVRAGPSPSRPSKRPDVERPSIEVDAGAARTSVKRWTRPGGRPNDLDRRFDKTQLKSTIHGYVVHRDYAAHFFRWGFIFRLMEYRKTRVLDLGCGQECPLARILSFRMAAVPGLWVGVDLNKIPKPPGMAWARTHDQFSFVDRHEELVREYGSGSFDLVTCFEVIEHMHPEDGARLLAGAADLLSPDGRMYLSTPVYNGRKMAANHLHEYGVDELRDLIEGTGRWEVERRFGTFASWGDLKKVASPEEIKLYVELNEYYDHEVLACFLAPKYPDASRNNVWVLRRKGGA